MSAKVMESSVKQVLEVACDYCDEVFSITVNVEDFEKWAAGAFVQNAFPYLTIDERELMISRTCGGCFDRMFGEID